MPKRTPAKPDANRTAVKLVRAVTETDKVNGEDLLGSPELKRKLREAKKLISKPLIEERQQKSLAARLKREN